MGKKAEKKDFIDIWLLEGEKTWRGGAGRETHSGIVLDEVRRVAGYSDDTRSRALSSQQVINTKKI